MTSLTSTVSNNILIKTTLMGEIAANPSSPHMEAGLHPDCLSQPQGRINKTRDQSHLQYLSTGKDGLKSMTTFQRLQNKYLKMSTRMIKSNSDLANVSRAAIPFHPLGGDPHFGTRNRSETKSTDSWSAAFSNSSHRHI